MADSQFQAPSSHKPDKNRTLVKIGEKKPVLDVEFNEMQEIQNHLRAEMYRAMVHSGVLDIGTPFVNNWLDNTKTRENRTVHGFNNLPNIFQASVMEAIVNGYKLKIFNVGQTNPVAGGSPNLITLPEPPTFGTRDDLVFLEAWFENIDTVKDPTLIDSRVGSETARRVELKWRIRTVAGVDFDKYPEGIGVFSIFAQGGNASPNTDTSKQYDYTGFWSEADRSFSGAPVLHKVFVGDKGLYVAGDGSQTSKDLLQSADGYVYAIPLFRVKRRNSGGYQEDNLNGAKDYVSVTIDSKSTTIPAGETAQVSNPLNNSLKLKVGDNLYDVNGNVFFEVVSITNENTLTVRNISGSSKNGLMTPLVTKSDRPDGKFSNIIDKDDIIDLRHKVSLTGVNYQQLLEENFDKLLRGELQTKDKPNMVKERFGLTPAPLGMKKQLLPTSVKGDDNVYRDLYNYLYGDQAYPAGKYLHQLNDANLKLKVDGADKTGTNVFQLSKKSATMTSDFAGKVSGSKLENPHDYRRRTNPVLGSPVNKDNGSEWVDPPTPDYDQIKALDNNPDNTTTSGSNNISQHLFSFDLIAHVERKYGITLSGTTADKVQWLKDNVKKFTANWHGKGSSPTGNKATLNAYLPYSSMYSNYPVSHTNSTITKLISAWTNVDIIDSNGFVHYLAYAEPSNGTIASVIETDYVSLDVELHAHSSALEPTQPYAVLTDDFTGKVSGSMTENPHTFKWSASPSLTSPSGGWTEFSTVAHTEILTQNGMTRSFESLSSNMAQHLFSFNLIEIVERKYGKIPAGDTAGKVQWLKDNLKTVKPTWYGKGSSPTGNKASFGYWHVNSNAWGSTFKTHTNNMVTALVYDLLTGSAIPNIVDSTGFVHFLAYADASDGVTASKIETDYINIEVELKAGAKVLDPKSAVYSVSDVDYTAIPSMDSTAIANKFPLVKNYPNIGSNKINLTGLTLGKYLGSDGTEVSSNASDRFYSDYIPVTPNTKYLANYDGNFLYAYSHYYDASKTRIGNMGVGGSGAPTTLGNVTSFTTPSNAYYIRISHMTNQKDLLVIAQEDSFVNTSVPYGRWLLPRDTASGETPTRISDFSNHNQRRTWGDPQLSDTVSEIIDPVSTPQPHIKVTQATAGQWTQGDTIKIKSDNGFVTGVLDNDTALARILGYPDGQTDYRNSTSSKTQIKLDSVSKLAVNDTIMLMMWDSTASATRTITAIDTTNNIITVNTAFDSINIHLYAIFETTASTSSPLVKNTDTSGNANQTGMITWSGLGTKEVTGTLGALPTSMDAKKPFMIQYSVNYPAGKGIVNVPSEVLQAEVNGQKLVKASDSIVRIKANFEGKVSGNTDLVPHKVEHNSNGSQTTLIPATTVMGELGQASYNTIFSLDGVKVTPSTTVNGAMAQTRFSFNIIRAIEDKLGEQFFSDCLTLADKITKAGQAVNQVLCAWYGKGSSPIGNKATMYVWRQSTGQWLHALSSPSYTGSDIGKLEGNSLYVAYTNSMIDPNGFVHFLVSADASNGTVASTIETDYVEMRMDLVNVAETGYDVLVPEEQFPILVDNPKMFKEGENMIPPFTDARWTIHANAKVLSPYEMVLTANAGYQNSTIIIPAEELTKYKYTVENQNISGQRYDTDALDASGTKIGSALFSSLPYNREFTTPAGTKFLRMNVTSDVTGAFQFKNLMLTISDKVKPFVPYNKDVKRRKKLDFLGKVEGSLFENPHKMWRASNTGFGAPSTFTIEESQQAYNDASKPDGLLRQYVNTTTGLYVMQMFEFDLSHLGLSLTELKSALRKLTVKWTGYGKGTNGSSVGYGAKLKSWDGGATTSTPKWWDLTSNTGSSPSELSYNQFGTFANFVDNNQKVYFLVHSTYPAGTASASEIYTDYISLEVELADYVDYVKGNAVKVRKETKELKLQYPKKSYRSGQEDKVELSYKATPKQVQSSSTTRWENGQKKVLYRHPFIMALTEGTGKYNPNSGRDTRYINASQHIPNTKFKTSDMYGESLILGHGHTSLMIFPLNSYYQGGMRDKALHVYTSLNLLPKKENIAWVAMDLYVENGELMMEVLTRFGYSSELAAGLTYELGTFKLDGRPLIKEVN